MEKRLQDRTVEEIKQDLIRSNMPRVQPGDEVGRRRVIKLAEIHARQLADLVAPEQTE